MRTDYRGTVSWFRRPSLPDAVRRADLPWSEKARSYRVIARYVLQVQKWRSVIAKTIGGKGLAGEYPTLSQAALTKS